MMTPKERATYNLQFVNDDFEYLEDVQIKVFDWEDVKYGQGIKLISSHLVDFEHRFKPEENQK